MEYLEGETLAERLKRDKTIPEKEAIDLLMPVMKSLEVVHKEGIIHRDIAPDNIFITKDGEVKLIDFGASRFATTSHSRSLTVIIKPGYSAEEQYRSRSDQGPYTDVYSIAATLYKMITGETPPDALERRAKIENAKKDILPEPHKITKDISLIAENAILNALNIRIEDRTQTVEQLISDLTAEEPVKRVYGKIKRIDFYRMPLWLKIMVPALFVVFITFGTLLATGVISFASLFKTNVEVPEGYTIVPEIEGLDIEKATNELKSSSLNYTTGGNVTSDYIAANLIVYQDPESGKIIPKNSVVQITVSRGTGIVEIAKDGISTVPIFVWSEESLAISDFEKAGLTTTIEYIFDENVSAGQVIRATDTNGTNIEAGMELPEGTNVILYVSKGPEGFPMPNVIGYTENDAKEILDQSGLVAVISYQVNSSVSAGTVFSQNVDADSTVTLGTEIEIIVATAPETTSPETTVTTTAATVATTTTEATEATVEETYTTVPLPTDTPVPTNTPIPTNTPTPTPLPEIGSIDDVDIHHEEGTDYIDVSVSVNDYYSSNVEWSSSNSNIVSVSGNGTSARLTWKSRGTTTVTASISGTNVSTSFTVRCWDVVYGDWGPIQQSTSGIDESDTVRRCDPYTIDVEVGTRHASCVMDYWLFSEGNAKNWRGFYNYNRNYGTLRYHWSNECGYYVHPCSDGSTPDGFIAVAPGGTSNGEQSGTNMCDATGYYDPNSDGRMFFIVDYNDETVYETRYQYQERSKTISCD